jgi:hypothetical protein
MLILRAAYGRKYRTREEALKDWEDGKDFKIKDGPYMSVRDSHLVRNHVLMIEFGPNNKCITRAS